MNALLRFLGPLWMEMVPWYSEFVVGSYERFRGHDGLFMMAAQLKHPSLVKLFLGALESQGFPREPPDQDMVTRALRHVAMEYHLNEAESDNLDSQGTCRCLPSWRW